MCYLSFSNASLLYVGTLVFGAWWGVVEEWGVPLQQGSRELSPLSGDPDTHLSMGSLNTTVFESY